MVDRRASELGLPSGLSRDDAYVSGVADGGAQALSTINQHIPSLSDEDEQTITGLVFDIAREGLTFSPDPMIETDVASLAIRTCMCGRKIIDFYDYVDHLREVMGQEVFR